MSAEYLPDLSHNLPANDELDAFLSEYAQNAAAHEDTQSDKEAELTALRTMQDVAWGQHCATTIPERQLTWDVVISSLRDAQPAVTPDSYPWAAWATWKFAALRKTGGAVLQLATEITAKSETAAPDEIYVANRYLEEPRSGRKCPDMLLGVQAEGRLMRKSLPLGALGVACSLANRNHLLSTVRHLEARTQVTSLGSSAEPKELYKVDLSATWNDPDKREFYLEPGNAREARRFALKDIPIELRSPETDQEAIMAFLQEDALGMGFLQKQYVHLGAITEILAESSPL